MNLRICGFNIILYSLLWNIGGRIHLFVASQVRVLFWNSKALKLLSRTGIGTLLDQPITGIALIDSKEEFGDYHPNHKIQGNSLKEQLLSVVAKEENLWKQKCKTNWLRDCDINSFHGIMAAKKRKFHQWHSV